jgi:hypothetical protein
MDADESTTAGVVHCDTHGDGGATFVCRHLVDGTAAAMFSEPPRVAVPWPDAWCERCEAQHAARGGWTDEAEAFAGLSVLCSGCYSQRRLLLELVGPDDEAPFPFVYRCASCDETHAGLPTWVAEAPLPWLDASAEERAAGSLDDALCTVGGHRFVRGDLDIPILGSRQRMSWGVWTSLSEQSFARTVEHWTDPDRVRQPPCFGWLVTILPPSIYPDTQLLKCMVHMRPPGHRPLVIVEPTAHPLAIDQRRGITRERAEAVTIELLRLLGGTRLSGA